MRKLTVELDSRSYEIIVGHSILGDAGKMVRAVQDSSTTKLALISNESVFRHYGSQVKESLEASSFNTVSHLIPDGEAYKTLSTLEELCRRLAQSRLDRHASLIALGGGVIGDIVGFTASSFLRGIGFIQIPTTLLAMIDSSIGGKTGVNLPEGKNLVGAFYQPQLVIIDLELLQTLPLRELRAGLYEALKYGVISDSALFDLVVQTASVLPPFSDNRWEELVIRCCQIKADIVAADERESGLRQVLNLGHTFGHAAETVTDYQRFKHGEAVGHGIILAARLARRLSLIDPDESRRIELAVRSIGPLPPMNDLSPEDIVQAMRVDKKAQRDQLTFILPLGIGSVKRVTDAPLQAVYETLRELGTKE